MGSQKLGVPIVRILLIWGPLGILLIWGPFGVHLFFLKATSCTRASHSLEAACMAKIGKGLGFRDPNTAQNIVTLSIGPPKKVPLILGYSYMLHREASRLKPPGRVAPTRTERVGSLLAKQWSIIQHCSPNGPV